MCPEMYFFTNKQFIMAHQHYYCLDNIPLHSVNQLLAIQVWLIFSLQLLKLHISKYTE